MSEEASKRIEENRQSHDPVLALDLADLEAVPAELSKHTWLEELSLGKRHYGERNAKSRPFDLTPLSKLTGLRRLALNSASVVSLDGVQALVNLERLDIEQTAVPSLGPISKLTNLTELLAEGAPIRDLQPLQRLSRLQTLRVSSTEVASLTPLASLQNLKELAVSQTSVSDLSPIAGLQGLATLDASYTAVNDVRPLSTLHSLTELDLIGTKVSDLSPIATLHGLRHLRVSNTPTTTLPDCSRLSSLESVFVDKTGILDLSPLRACPALIVISAEYLDELDLSPLSGLQSLRSLYLKESRLRSLEVFASLPALNTLRLTGSPVEDLAPLLPLLRRGLQVKVEDGFMNGIFVQDCPLGSPPAEIAKHGNEAILSYFAERAAGEVDRLYEAKMLILGEGGAGKTSLLRRLYQPDAPLPGESETTRGIDIHHHSFRLKNGRGFRLNVWDFGGQEIYHATHQFFLTRRSLYLLLDDTRKDHKSVSDEGFRYWLELIDLLGGHSPVLVFQNEKGGRSKQIDQAGIKGRYDNVQAFYAGDLDKIGSADTLRDAIEHYATTLAHVGDPLPARWLAVRAEIEQRAAELPYIGVDEYFEIYAHHLEFQEDRALHLSRYLHDLGVFLHYQDDPLLARTVILQNAWATEAVFRVLDDEQVKANAGRFDLTDCRRLWDAGSYRGMHPELLALMQRFELCYPLADRQPSTWIAPQLLSPTQPSALLETASADDLVIRYRYEFLPKGLLARLIVRLHRFLTDPGLAWTTGAMFRHQGSTVFTSLLPNGREIELRASGPDRKALLSVVSADIDALNESFRGLREKVDRRIPCCCSVCRTAETPHFFDQRKLLKRREDRRLTVECDRSYEQIEINALVDGVRVELFPDWAKAQPQATPRPVKVFLASSAELRADRDAIELFLLQRNETLLEIGHYLRIVRWETESDSVVAGRKQDEYNKALRGCDVAVVLVGTKVGKYTREEFEAAYTNFLATGQPRILPYFKQVLLKTGQLKREDVNSLLDFRERLAALEQFPSDYEHVGTLTGRLRDQIEALVHSGELLRSLPSPPTPPRGSPAD